MAPLPFQGVLGGVGLRPRLVPNLPRFRIEDTWELSAEGSWTASPIENPFFRGRFMGSFVFLKVEHCGTWELNFLLFLKGYVGVGCCSCHCMIPSFHFDTPRPNLAFVAGLKIFMLAHLYKQGELTHDHAHTHYQRVAMNCRPGKSGI